MEARLAALRSETLAVGLASISFDYAQKEKPLKIGAIHFLCTPLPYFFLLAPMASAFLRKSAQILQTPLAAYPYLRAHSLILMPRTR